MTFTYTLKQNGVTKKNGYIAIPSGQSSYTIEGNFMDYNELTSVTETDSFDLEIVRTTGSSAFISYDLHYPVIDTVTHDKMVGGVRVKKMTDNDGLNASIDHVKEYEYKAADGFSSGLLMMKPMFTTDLSFMGVGHGGAHGTCGTLTCLLSSNITGPSANSEGSHIGYQYVKVKESGNGYSTYQYNISPPEIFDSNNYNPETSLFTFPVLPEYNCSLLNGKLISEQHFNEDETLLKSTIYNYSEYLVGDLPAQIVSSTGIPMCQGGQANSGRTAGWVRDYYIHYSRVYLTSQTETLDGVSKATTFTYRTDWKHHNPVETSFYNSDGKKQTTVVKYAWDVSSGNHPKRQALLDSFMISVPLEQLHYVDDVLTSGNKTVYKAFSGKILPEQFYEIEGGEFQLQGTVQDYTADGFPASFIREHYTYPEVYTWQNRKLIAKQYNERNWHYDYYPNTGQLKTTIDYNDQRADFEYDDFQRLYKVKKRPLAVDDTSVFNIVTTYTYQYRYNDLALNRIQASTQYSDAPAMTTVDYVDGLGRPISHILVEHSPSENDVVTATEYDNIGRVKRQYLPFESDGGGDYVGPNSGTGFTETTYEPSPLNRKMKDQLPSFGEIGYTYGSNGEDVKNCLADSYYDSKSLFLSRVTDENSHDTETYTDLLGRTILTRKFVEDALNPDNNNSNIVDTYRVYEDNGDLKAVVPPLASGIDDVLFGYQYLYDARHRMIQKALPGAGIIRYYYDERDRLTDVQDILGRHIQNEYDEYDRLESSTLAGTGVDLTEIEYAGVTDYIAHKNVAVLDPDNPGNKIEYQYYLDDWGRTIEVKNNNYVEGNDDVTTTYNHADQVLNTTLEHTAFGQSSMEIDLENRYDNGHRLIDVSHRISGGGLLSDNGVHVLHQNYNYKDELIQKLLNENSSGAPFDYLQSVDYQYNNRGFLTKINQLGLTGKGLPLPQICRPDTGIHTVCTERSCIKQSIRNIKISVGVDKDKLNEMGFGWVHYRFEAKAKPLESEYYYDVATDTVIGAGSVTGAKDSVFANSFQIEIDSTITVQDSLSKDTVMQAVQTKLTQQLTQAGVQTQQADSVAQSVMQALALDFLVPTTGPPVSMLDDNDLFAEQLYYASSNSAMQAPAQFNGNISMAKWQTQGRNIQVYGYSYDGLDRLKSATYSDLLSTNSGCVYSGDDRYTVNGIRYDHHGNIRTMQRHGMKLSKDHTCYTPEIIDFLRYTYNGNQVQAIKDYADDQTGFIDGAGAETEYTYDEAGNLTSDLNKGIELIEYNHLNLPQKIVFSQNREIHFAYTAEGQKLSKSLYVDNEKIATRYYAAGMEYRNDTLDFVSQPEGRVLVLHGDTLRYEYSIRDHLGDTRITFSDLDHNGLIEKSNDEIIQESHYDPWGMELTGIWQKQWDTLHPTAYLYNNKEFNEDFGLNWSDYGARWYDATDGRWWVVDPVTDNQEAWSPYDYVYDNAVRLTDPDGREAVEGGPDDGGPGLLAKGLIFLAGVTNAIGSDLTGGAPGTLGNPNDFGAYSSIAADGQTAGHILTAVVGTAATALSVAGVAVETFILPETGGGSGLAITPTAAVGVQSSIATAAALKSLLGGDTDRMNAKGESNQGSGQGRGKNNRQPDPKAEGHHSVINDKGHTTYKQNSKNPTGYSETRRIDTKGKPHTNTDGTKVPTPHVHRKGLKDVQPAVKGRDY